MYRLLGRLSGRVLVALILAFGGLPICTEQPSSAGPLSALHGSPPTSVPSEASVGRRLGSTCQVQLPASWKRLMTEGLLERQKSESLIAHPTAGIGGLAVESHGAKWSGVELVTQAGARIKVRPFKDPGRDLLFAAAWDGRFLVWSEIHSVYNWNGWDLWSWDSSTRRIREISRARWANGDWVKGPLQYPAIHDGRAFWAQGNADGTSRIVATDLSTAANTTIVKGYASAPTVLRGLLLWAESPTNGAPSGLRALDLDTHKPMTVPSALRQVPDPNWLRAYGDRLVWTTSDNTRLFTWAWGQKTAPDMLASLAPVDHIGEPQVAGQLVVWTGDRTPFAYDLRSGARVQLTGAWGGVDGSGSTLEIAWPGDLEVKKTDGSPVSVIDARRLPALGHC